MLYEIFLFGIIGLLQLLLPSTQQHPSSPDLPRTVSVVENALSRLLLLLFHPLIWLLLLFIIIVVGIASAVVHLITWAAFWRLRRLRMAFARNNESQAIQRIMDVVLGSSEWTQIRERAVKELRLVDVPRHYVEDLDNLIANEPAIRRELERTVYGLRARAREQDRIALPVLDVMPNAAIAQEKNVGTTNLLQVKGIGAAYAHKLNEAGISTMRDILEQGASPQGRREISETTGISGKMILRWVNQVDLFRISGVTGDYATLLVAVGVNTVPELAQQNDEDLYQKLAEVNQDKELVNQLFLRAQVKNWIEQAKQLPEKVTY